jgi:hypothetical protein
MNSLVLEGTVHMTKEMASEMWLQFRKAKEELGVAPLPTPNSQLD